MKQMGNAASTAPVQSPVLLTPEQEKAVESLHCNTIVPAGAGSGKTRVLVERFLRIVEENPRQRENVLDSIIAITFTEKAALEMKERVHAEIAKRLLAAQQRGDHAAEAFWQRMWQERHRAVISTIHSLCARLLREYPVEAEVDPAFTVLDETESQWLLAGAVDEALQKLIPQNRAVKNLCVAHGYARLARETAALYQQVAGSGLSVAEVRAQTDAHRQNLVQQVAQRLTVEVEQLMATGDELARFPEMTKTGREFAQRWPSWRESLAEAGRNRAWPQLNATLAEILAMVKKSWGTKKELTRVKNAWKEQRLLPLYQLLQGYFAQAAEEEGLDGVFALLEEVDKEYEEAKIAAGGLDFDELQRRTCDLLEHHAEVREQVQQRCDFLMIDEFQDTNGLQKRLVELLVRRKDGIPPGTLFVVGDAKQSIYRFRGADVRVFMEMQQELQEARGQVAPLLNNFRSDPRLLAFINAFFGEAMSADETSPNFYRKAVAQGSLSAREGLPVECLLLPPPQEQKPGAKGRTLEARWIARRIGELRNEGFRWGDIALLFRSMTFIKRYEEALSAAGIPYYVVGGRGFYQKQEILDLVNLLTWLDDPTHRIAWAGMLRSPYAGLSDEALFLLSRGPADLHQPESWMDVPDLPEEEREKLRILLQWLLPVKERVGRIAVDRLVQDVIEESGIRPVLLATPEGRQACANLDKFLLLARRLRRQGSCSLHDFLARVALLCEGNGRETEAAVETSKSDAVQLMTIHQAKGLEFPVVILPDLSRTPPINASLFTFSVEEGVTYRGEAEEGHETPLRHREGRKREQRLEQEESLRLLYVAMTRAKERLVLSLIPEVAKNKEEKELLQFRKWSEWLDVLLNLSEAPRECGPWSTLLGEEEISLARVVYEEEGEASSSFSLRSNLLENIMEKEAPVLLPETSDALGQREFPSVAPLSVAAGERLISVSALMTYALCPRRYYFTYGLSMPPWEGAEEGERDELESSVMEEEADSVTGFADLSPAMKGTLAHKLIELLPAPVEGGPQPIDEGVLRMALKEAVRVLDLDVTPDSLSPDLQRWMHHYLQSDFYLRGAEQRWHNEISFSLPLHGHVVEGVIDRVIETKDGKMMVLDFKTNRLHGVQDLQEKAQLYAPQIYLYALAAADLWGRAPLRAGLFFLDAGLWYGWEIDEAWMNAAQKKAEHWLSGIAECSTLQQCPPRPGSACKYCPYRLLCPANGDEKR